MSDNFENNKLDIYSVEFNDPLNTPARVYKKFQHLIDFETLFKNIDHFDIDVLYNYIKKAFEYIKETDMMLSVNVDVIENNDKINDFEDLKEALNHNDLDSFDYKNQCSNRERQSPRTQSEPSNISYCISVQHQGQLQKK